MACQPSSWCMILLLDFSLTVKAATLIFISGRGLAISSAKEGKSGYILKDFRNAPVIYSFSLPHG